MQNAQGINDVWSSCLASDQKEAKDARSEAPAQYGCWLATSTDYVYG